MGPNKPEDSWTRIIPCCLEISLETLPSHFGMALWILKQSQHSAIDLLPIRFFTVMERCLRRV